MRSAAAAGWRLAGAIAVTVLALDQASKAAVEAELYPGERIDLLGPLELTLTHNDGVAFGLAGGGGVALVVVALAGLGLIAWIFGRDPARPGAAAATGLLLGGALGNLIDRVRAGEVTDFIDIGPWPAFNLADVAITAGVLLLVLSFQRRPGGD